MNKQLDSHLVAAEAAAVSYSYCASCLCGSRVPLSTDFWPSNGDG